MDKQELDIKEGTITFWLNEGKINYNDNKVTPIIQLTPKGGSIFMVKDDDNKIKFFHVFLGKGRTDLEYDVSLFDSKVKHMFAVTWSVPNKEIILYIDGKQVAKASIAYQS